MAVERASYAAKMGGKGHYHRWLGTAKVGGLVEDDIEE
jgi:hypothetical protein